MLQLAPKSVQVDEALRASASSTLFRKPSRLAPFRAPTPTYAGGIKEGLSCRGACAGKPGPYLMSVLLWQGDNVPSQGHCWHG